MAQKSQLPPKATQAECPLPGAFTSQQQREELAQSNFSEQSLAPAPRMSVQRGPSHVLRCHSHWLLQHSPGLPLMPPLEPGHPRRCTRCEEEGGGRRSPALCPYGCWSLWDGSLNATPVTDLGRSCQYLGGRPLPTGIFNNNAQISQQPLGSLLYSSLFTHPINKEPKSTPCMCWALGMPQGAGPMQPLFS